MSKLTATATLALALALAACSSADDSGEPVADESELKEGALELYFTNPLPDLLARGEVKEADVGALATRTIAKGGAPDKRLVQLIDQATGKGCSVLLANFDFNLQNVADAMVRAKKRGCDVRMVTDGDTVDKANPSTDPATRYGRHHFHAEYEKPLAAILAAGIPVHDDGARGGIMHNKFVVLNGKTVWTGSWNMSMGDLNYWNHAIVLNSAPLAARFTANFEFLFKEFAPAMTPGNHVTKVDANLPTDHALTIGGRPVEVFFPRSDKATKRVAEVLSQAKESIHFMAFQFTLGAMSDAVLDRAKNGVEVRGVYENNGACTGSYPALLASPGHVTVSRWGMGHLDGLRDFLHHKVFIIDQKTVVIGSFNFSASADTSNDENLLIITDPAIAAAFEQELLLIEEATAKTKQAAPCPNPIHAVSSEKTAVLGVP